MSNIQQNQELNKMRVKLRISEMNLALERADVRLLELEDEKIRVKENRDATLTEIENLKKQLGGM
jgi:hypothetical protein